MVSASEPLTAAALQDGCQPNVVTYNTLIDVYGKTGLWSEAVKVLERMRQAVSGGLDCAHAGACRLPACLLLGVAGVTAMPAGRTAAAAAS